MGGIFIWQYLKVYRMVKAYHARVIRENGSSMTPGQVEILNSTTKEVLKFFLYVTTVLIAQFWFKVCELIDVLIPE